MSWHDSENFDHAFICSRLYCNGVFTGLPEISIRQLQLIYNSAARELTKTKTVDLIARVLRFFTLASCL